MTWQVPLNFSELSYGRTGGMAGGWPVAVVPPGGRTMRRGQSVRAGLAELVLLNRLRAQARGQDAVQTLERAAQILEVTSRHWFGEADDGMGLSLAP